MKKLNAEGIAHQIALVAIVVMALIGGIGGYIFLKGGESTEKLADAATASAVCGTGYVTVKSIGVYNHTSGPAVATLSVNRTTNKACAVLMSTGAAYGVRKSMSIGLKLWDDNGRVLRRATPNSGLFKYYAGPIYVSYQGYESGYAGKVPTWLTINGTMTYKNVKYATLPDDMDFLMKGKRL